MDTYQQLRLELIEEGAFIVALQKALLRMQRDLIEHRNRYGDHATVTDKAKLVAEIVLAPDPQEEDHYVVTTRIKTAMPGRPPRKTLALGSHDPKTGLRVRASGSGDDSPTQMRLTTADGRPIDLQTGEVIEKEDDQTRDTGTG